MCTANFLFSYLVRKIEEILLLPSADITTAFFFDIIINKRYKIIFRGGKDMYAALLYFLNFTMRALSK